MIQELEENPKLVELYRELERIQKAENERTGYDQDINSLHSHIQYILEHTNHENAGAAIELARFIESKGIIKSDNGEIKSSVTGKIIKDNVKVDDLLDESCKVILERINNGLIDENVNVMLVGGENTKITDLLLED